MEKAWKQVCAFSLGALLFVAVQSQAAQEDQTQEGRQIYELRCASCHGLEAEKLVGKPVQYLADRMQDIKRMHDPLLEKMRRMQQALEPLSDDQIENIALYLHKLQ